MGFRGLIGNETRVWEDSCERGDAGGGFSEGWSVLCGFGREVLQWEHSLWSKPEIVVGQGVD